MTKNQQLTLQDMKDVITGYELSYSFKCDQKEVFINPEVLKGINEEEDPNKALLDEAKLFLTGYLLTLICTINNIEKEQFMKELKEIMKE